VDNPHFLVKQIFSIKKGFVDKMTHCRSVSPSHHFLAKSLVFRGFQAKALQLVEHGRFGDVDGKMDFALA